MRKIMQLTRPRDNGRARTEPPPPPPFFSFELPSFILVIFAPPFFHSRLSFPPYKLYITHHDAKVTEQGGGRRGEKRGCAHAQIYSAFCANRTNDSPFFFFLQGDPCIFHLIHVSLISLATATAVWYLLLLLKRSG